MGNRRGYAEWRYMIGKPETWSELSPIAHVADLNRPALIGHGEQDQTVPIRHSNRFVLAAPSGMTQFVRLPGVGHTLPSNEQQREWYVRVAQFLRSQLNHAER